MTAWTWSRSRCGREWTGPRTLHPGPAHPPAVAGPSRSLAGRRGMALPVVVGSLPTVDAGAADTCRRGPSSSGDTRHDAGGHRATGRSLQPDWHAPLAGQLAATRTRGNHTSRTLAGV